MGYTVNTHRRMNAQSLMEAQIQLSDRHRQWGDDCPMVDLDFLMCEYNHGVPVAIVDYKFHGAQLTQTSVKTYETLSGFYDKDHLQIPVHGRPVLAGVMGIQAQASQRGRDRLSGPGEGRPSDRSRRVDSARASTLLAES